ncbi:MAG: molybdate ABC transporter substrate-binding protein [Caldilinea sp.]|nr:molybdate ABC transporter substrate-binding protein [Caldilinea sp.]
MFVNRCAAMRSIWGMALIVLGLAVGCAAPPASADLATPIPPLTVAAAANLQFAFTEIAALYEAHTGQPVTLVFGSTGQLAQQIENGAPFDLFAAANIAFIEQLRDKGLLLPETIALYAEGRIVLAVNRNFDFEVDELIDLASSPVQRVAIANPEHAPYGVAAKEALLNDGVWELVEPKLVYGENGRQTLQFVQTGDAQAGIVALSIADVPEISWTLIDADLHTPLLQALAVVRSSPQPDAASAFAAFINGEEGRPIMQRYGFVLPGESLRP